MWSHDDGLTWGKPATMGFKPNEGGLLGPSVGLQAKDGTLYVAGRLTPDEGVASLLSRGAANRPAWLARRGAARSSTPSATTAARHHHELRCEDAD